LSVKSIASYASLVAPICSTAGMPIPRRTSSRSPKGLGRCSAELSSSADSRIFVESSKAI
jgi:hypothetical protein